MAYAKQNAGFQRDKQQFFQHLPAGLNDQIKFIDKRSSTIGYAYLLNNQKNLLEEFTHMWNVLEKESTKDREPLWMYSYYCASLLEAFYQAYAQEGEAAKYAGIKQTIKDRLSGVNNAAEPEPSLIQSLFNSFVDGFSSLLKSPLHLSQIRDYVAYSNLCRIYWAFCRLTLTNGLRLARDLDFINKLDAILGTHTDVEKIISVFEAPIGIINYFSVAFFLMRFAIDFSLLIKHTFFPSELENAAERGCDISLLTNMPGPVSLEAYRNNYIVVVNEKGEMELYYIPKVGDAQKLRLKEQKNFATALQFRMQKESTVRLNAQEIQDLITHATQEEHAPEASTAWDRFKHELYKRHCNFANDLVWATVNLLTNFNAVFGIPGPIAGAITVVFLGFDVCMALYKCHLAKQEYLAKRAQYELEVADYLNPNKYKNLSENVRLMHIDILRKELKNLDISYKAKESTFYFGATAAALLMMGFTAALVFTPGLMIVGSFFVCTLAVAMYLSTGAYAKYKEKSLYLEDAECSGKNLVLSKKEYEAACNDFIYTMVKNTVVPMVLISTFAICWPAALVLTAMYLGYEFYHALDQQSEMRAAKQLSIAVSAPPDDALTQEDIVPSCC